MEIERRPEEAKSRGGDEEVPKRPEEARRDARRGFPEAVLDRGTTTDEASHRLPRRPLWAARRRRGFPEEAVWTARRPTTDARNLVVDLRDTVVRRDRATTDDRRPTTDEAARRREIGRKVDQVLRQEDDREADMEATLEAPWRMPWRPLEAPWRALEAPQRYSL